MADGFNINEELKRILEQNGLAITVDEYQSITDIYEATIKEQSKQYYNYADKTKLLEGILQQTKQGASPTDIYQAFSDVRHYELYENFMGSDERRRMVNSLKDAGIPLDVLKGVRIDKNGDVLKPNESIEIRYKFDEDEHGSLTLEYFEIIELDEYGEEEKVFGYENEMWEFDEEVERERSSPRTVKGRSSMYSGRITNTDIGDVKMWVDKNGRTFYTDSKGHRVKVRNGQVQERIVWEEE